jgi:SAM-dependent methyltransferase
MTPDRSESGINRDKNYRRLVKTLLAGGDADRAMHQAIGGNFESIGLMERDFLIFQGLEPGGFVIDIGCGSGRLAAPLSQYLRGPYLGTDVVPELLEYARTTVDRPDWKFELADGLRIPATEGSADVVCFFSLFTHLLHEESYTYLLEARRVLKPTGRIIFSFLEFAIWSHWSVFESDLAAIGTDAPHNQFMSRDGIQAWATHLEMQVLDIFDGDTPHIPLSEPVTMENGTRYESLGALGQSIAVLGF